MSQPPIAPNALQGTIADINGKIVYATDAEDSAFTSVSQQQQIQLYPSITIDVSGQHDPDHNENTIEALLKSAASEFLPFLQSRLGLDSNNKLFSLLNTISESFGSLVSTRYPVPTDHHLFSANAPPLRTMAWHPHRTILAVAHEDHRIYIYEYNSLTIEWGTRILEHRYMADITSLDWKKYCHGTLAVGCRTGVCVWFLNSSSDSTSNHYDFMPTTTALKPHHQQASNAYMHFFSTPGHHHISAVAWDPSIGSQTLAVASAVDSMLIMYDLLTFNHTPLKRNGKGNALLRWSPDGRYLYVGGLGGKARLWETQNWTNNEIKNPPGLWVKSACWTPDSCSLYYNMVGKEDIHLLYIEPGSAGIQGLWDIKILSTPPASVPTALGGPPETVGGVIKELALDPTGTRLAVSYEFCNLVSLYSVKANVSPISLTQGQELKIIGYIRGMDVSQSSTVAEPMKNTKADHLAFIPSVTNGAALSISWKNNKVSFVSVKTV